MIAKVSAVLLIVGTLAVGQVAEVAAQRTNRGNSGGAFSTYQTPQSSRSNLFPQQPWPGNTAGTTPHMIPRPQTQCRPLQSSMAGTTPMMICR